MNKKSAILFGALFLSVALAGVAYAHWLEIITLDGFVQTGTLELIPALVDVQVKQDKPVAVVTYDSDYENDYVWINMKNVYPCLVVTGNLTFYNVGTIPAGLEEVRLTVWEDAGDFVWVQGSHTDYDYYLILVNELDGQEALQIGVKFGANPLHQPYPGAPPNSIYQVDDGEHAWMVWYVHFYEGIPESSEFWFNVEFEYWNWNEAAEEDFSFVYETVDGARP